MRKHWKVWFCALAITLLAVAWAFWPEPEPHYRGRPLSYWVRSLAVTYPGEDWAAAREAIRAFGTNSVPSLLKWISHEPSPLRKNLENSMRSVVPARVISIPKRSGKQRLADGARVAFAILGTNAIVAVPELERLAQDAFVPETAARAIDALWRFGPNGVKGLLAVIDTPSHPGRGLAIRTLAYMRGSLDPCAEPVAAHLIRCLDEPPTNRIPFEAAEALGDLRLAPEISVPALEAKLSTSDPLMRVSCIVAIGEFDTQAVHALPLMYAALTNSDRRVREAAKWAVARIGSSGPPEVPGK